MFHRILVLIIAAAWDLLVGDPRGVIHPVQIIGKLIEAAEKLLRRALRISDMPEEDRTKKRVAGLILAFLVCGICTAAVYALTRLIYRIHPVAGVIVEGILCGQMLAMRSLKEAAESVRRPLESGDVEKARKAVSMIVGRDTQRLDASGIARAAIETVAENTSDGIIAPLLFEALFGAAGAYFYKTINTMDSMIGYRNDRYRYFGTAAARMDDVVNFLPARITAVFMIAAARLTGFGNTAAGEDGSGAFDESGKFPAGFRVPDAANAARIWRRDRRKHPSPNSAQAESVCAGALHIALAGPMYYFGELHEKPWIGDNDRPVRPEDIRRAERLMEGCAMLVFFAALVLLAVLTALFAGR